MTACLWFNKEAEEVAKFYVEIFSQMGRSAEIKNIARHGESGAKVSGKPVGSAMTVTFELDGQ